VRFEYNAPDTGLVVAGSNTVVIYDTKSNQPPETYPLARTPLSIILARDVNLGQARMVTGHTFDGTATTVTAQDPENPQYGNIQMKFTGPSPELRQWIINDGNGGQTTVVLGEFQKGGNLPNRLFDVGSNATNDR
jgi:outer membrane lipoprotein-sorting protein